MEHKNKIMTALDALKWEVGSSGLIKTILYRCFPRLAIWVASGKLKRYNEFLEFEERGWMKKQVERAFPGTKSSQ